MLRVCDVQIKHRVVDKLMARAEEQAAADAAAASALAEDGDSESSKPPMPPPDGLVCCVSLTCAGVLVAAVSLCAVEVAIPSPPSRAEVLARVEKRAEEMITGRYIVRVVPFDLNGPSKAR